MKITEKLPIEDQQSILADLFGFNLIDDGENGESHFVLYDEDGYEFYGSEYNSQFDLRTLKGIYDYVRITANENGKLDKQYEIRRALGL